MAEWVYIVDSTIEEFHSDLPASWKNISGLNLSKDNLPFLKSLGWFPVVKNYQQYDDLLYKIDGHDYEIQPEQVVESLRLVEKEPVNQPASFDFQFKKNKFLTQLRAERNKRLSDSDWSQLADIQATLTDELKIKWSTYRQSLRDLPEIYSTDEVINLAAVAWPEF